MDVKSKKIAVNTIFLTLRMILLTAISFYTSRVVLDKLGVEDFGIYNVVSSLAITFTFFSSALTNATQRFLTIELGRKDIEAAKSIFNQHFIVYVIIAVAVLIISEPLGIWYIDNKLNVDASRIIATHFTYQFAMATVLSSLLSIVFESLIIAHEDMKIYSYISVIEGLLKLLIVFMLVLSPFDKLVMYALLMAVISCVIKLAYTFYSFRKYEECHLSWYWDSSLIYKTFKFIGWNIFSSSQVAICDQGVSLLLNVYAGPIANAARGISAQVTGALFKFTNNILLAVQPQMVKSYACHDRDYLETLFLNTTRFVYVSLWVFVCPLLFCVSEVLKIWLVEVPMWTEGFVVFSLLTSCIYVLSTPVWSIIIASGQLKRYTLWTSIVALLLFPASFIILFIGGSPIDVYICNLVVTAINTVVRLYVLRSYFEYSVRKYMQEIVYRLSILSAISVLVAYMLSSFFSETTNDTIIFCVVDSIITLMLSFVIGLYRSERIIIIDKIRSVLK